MFLREVFAHGPAYQKNMDKVVGDITDPKYTPALSKIKQTNKQLATTVAMNQNLKNFVPKLQNIQRKIETKADPRDIPLWGQVFMLTTAAVFLFNKWTTAFAAAVADKDADGEVDFDDYNDMNPNTINTMFQQFDEITDLMNSPEWHDLDANDKKEFTDLADVMKGKLKSNQGWYQMQGQQDDDAERFNAQDMSKEEDELATSKLLSKTMKHEGGYTDNPADKGNYTKSGKLVGTNHGISAYLYELVKGKEPTAEDMQDLTKAEAVDIYKSAFIDVIIGKGNNQLGVSPDNPLAELLIDMNVKEGQGRFTKILGTALGEQGSISQIKGELKTQFEQDPAGTYDKIAKQYKIALNDRVDQMGPDYEQFRKGWNNRTDSWINSNPFKQAA